MTLRILCLNPLGSDVMEGPVTKTIDSIKGLEVEGRVVHLEQGTDSLEYHVHEHGNLTETLEWVSLAEREDYHAVVIGCFHDTGLREARELVSIPVLAPAESFSHVAISLGHRFSIIVGRRKWIPKLDGRIREYGVSTRLASFRSIEMSVPQMRAHPEQMRASTVREAGRAVKEDGAEAIVQGCTSYVGFMQEVTESVPVPVLDPVVVDWKWAEMAASLCERAGLSHSKIYEAADVT